jgi:hypothetical protein
MTAHGAPGPSLVIDTYGGVYSITRQAIINDDSGDLLNRNPADMGYAAGIFVAEALVALIESNPTAYDGGVLPRLARQPDDGGAVRGRARRRDHVHGVDARRRRLPHPIRPRPWS